MFTSTSDIVFEPRNSGVLAYRSGRVLACKSEVLAFTIDILFESRNMDCLHIGAVECFHIRMVE